MSGRRRCATIRPGMPTPPAPGRPAPFQDWLDRIARPIEFASRDEYAHLATVKNLSTFVSSQVLSALAQQVYPQAVEARLLSLRELFLDFHQALPMEEQRRRLQAAIGILRSLRTAARHLSEVSDEAVVLPSSPVAHSGESPADVWNLPIRFVKGVGPKRTGVLERLRIETVEDALWTVPWRYEDRSTMTPIGNLVPGMVTSICGIIAKCDVKRTRNRRLTVLDVGVEDETGRMQAVFFNQPYLEDILSVGKRVMMSGRVIAGRQGWMVPRMEVSQYEVVGEAMESALHVGRIVPIYHETKGWNSRQMRVLVMGLLQEHGVGLRDHLPVPLRARQRLVPIQEALQDVHFPKAGTDPGSWNRENCGASPAGV